MRFSRDMPNNLPTSPAVPGAVMLPDGAPTYRPMLPDGAQWSAPALPRVVAAPSGSSSATYNPRGRFHVGDGGTSYQPGDAGAIL